MRQKKKGLKFEQGQRVCKKKQGDKVLKLEMHRMHDIAMQTHAYYLKISLDFSYFKLNPPYICQN